MNTEDLKKVVHVANHGSLQTSAQALSVTPGALSKAIKRVETQLNCQLFLRTGTKLKLNRQGRTFLQSAAKLIQEIEQFSTQFSHSDNLPEIRLAAPAILSTYCNKFILDKLPKHQAVQFQCQFEGNAAKQVLNGAADIALITQEAKKQLPKEIETIELVSTGFSLACGDEFKKRWSKPLSLNKVISLPFVTPAVSPFCGREPNQYTDGWPERSLTRRVQFQCEDYSTLIKLVKENKAVAYLPDFVVHNEHLNVLSVPNLDSSYQEQILLMWRPSLSDSWLNKIMYKIKEQDY